MTPIRTRSLAPSTAEGARRVESASPEAVFRKARLFMISSLWGEVWALIVAPKWYTCGFCLDPASRWREVSMKNAKTKFVVGGAVIVAALGYLGFVGMQQSKAYYITVDEFRSMQGQLQGKTLKVAGDVVEGSIDRTQRPLQFTISHQGQSLKVHYVGKDVIPDTFKDGAKAVVEGTIATDGTFEARHIEAKCASKYEAEYQKKGT
ncbi:MAG: hypothetical protein DMG07_13575 [Acidobacteria bacterium]|nr:MAG: hypothetical protein DMG07_13575 [Acidobacteriota bacterium]